jgi:hypothetical protein
MAEPKPSAVRGGPNPRDQEEEREARIADMLARIKRHQEEAAYHQQRADHHQREADRHTELARRQKAEGPPRSRKRH